MQNGNYIPEGNTYIFEGPQRSGKTMGLVAFALDAHQSGKKVFSNFQLGFPHEPLEFTDIELEDGSRKFWNSFVCIDEWNFYYDCRRSLTGANLNFGTWLLQQKKQGCTLGGTTHALDSLDLRLRSNFDFLVRPKVYPAFPARPKILKLVVTNGPLQAPFRRTIAFDCEFLMKLYDTFAVYNPFRKLEAGATKRSKSRVNLGEL